VSRAGVFRDGPFAQFPRSSLDRPIARRGEQQRVAGAAGPIASPWTGTETAINWLALWIALICDPVAGFLTCRRVAGNLAARRTCIDAVAAASAMAVRCSGRDPLGVRHT
jgi:hypothetical protein